MREENNLNFGKSTRLCSRSQIAQLFDQGRVIVSYPIRASYLYNDTSLSKVVISVPKRSFKKAVDRNLIKRKIRESLRLKRFPSLFKRGINLSIVYLGKEIPEFSFINERIEYVLNKINTAD